MPMTASKECSILGVQHTIADYLSRLELGEEGTGVKYDFPNAQLFRGDTVTTMEMEEDTTNIWITKMTLFLSTGYHPKICP